MKIAIIGAGALGCLLGGLLNAADHDVWLVHHRQSYVEAVRARGVTIEDVQGADPHIDVRPRITTDADEVGVADLVLVLVNAQQTDVAVQEHGACIGSESKVLSLQNGLKHPERLRTLLPDANVFVGVTYQSAILKTPGAVVHTSPGETIFGGWDEDAANSIASAFEAAGIETTVSEKPLAHIWDKQLLGLAVKPLAALTRLPNGRLIEQDGVIEVMGRLIAEATQIAHAKDVQLLREDYVAAVVEVCRERKHHRSSMLQDVKADKKTEIDEINGAIVDYGEELKIETPFNAIVLTLVRGLEQNYLDSSSGSDPRK